MTRVTKPQVEPSHYNTGKYDSKFRFISYWYQVHEMISRKPANILYIGKGSGFINSYLSHSNFKILTLDIDQRLKPNIVGDLAELPILSKTFEMAACFQVLEHLPFHYFQQCLKELARVSIKWVIISLPDASRVINLLARSTSRIDFNFSLPVPRIKKSENVFTGEHHWEISKKGYYLKNIIEIIRSVNCKIEKTYRIPEHPYHRFFIIKS